MPVDITLTPARRGALTVLVADALTPLGVDAFVTDRSGGVSATPYDTLNLAEHVGDDPACVGENRRRVAAAAGVDLDRFITAQQVHGSDVVDADQLVDDVSADGLVTRDPSVAIAVMVADCVPVLVVDPSSSRVAVVHAGWRGLVADVLGNAVALFAQPALLHVLLGPAISVGAYQVGPEVAEHFAAVPGALVSDGGDRSRLDLRRVAVHQLRGLGVVDDHIYVTREVTDGGGQFFSDRAHRPSGRFALVARGPSMRAP